MLCDSVFSVERDVANGNVFFGADFEVDMVKACGSGGDQFELWELVDYFFGDLGIDENGNYVE